VTGRLPIGRLQFGYRLKVPLALTGSALVSGVLVALTTMSLVDRHVGANAEAETQRFAATLARALVQPVLRDDVWQAYQTVRAAAPDEAEDPARGEDRGPARPGSLEVVVMDADGVVFVSSTPRRFPVGSSIAELPAALSEAARLSLAGAPPGAVRATGPEHGQLALAVPVVGDDGSYLGSVLVRHPSALTDAQRNSIVRQLALLGAIAVALVALAGALLGLRMAAPIQRLREAMGAAPRRGAADGRAVADSVAQVGRRTDEIGDLARTFETMLLEIDAKHELERHMLEAERMANIGQLTAGLAHEVNNPLGGMLAAIENRRLRGGYDEHTGRTLALLERGLGQVHQTVQALLNEARRERHPLAPADVDDLEVLLRPEAEHARCALRWEVAPPAHALLPAVPVRQVVLNLALNGISAAGAGGTVRVWSRQTPSSWQLRVGNSGACLEPSQLDALTRGAVRSSSGRLGLGLWISARIMQSVRGRLWLDEPADARHATVLVAEFSTVQAEHATPALQ
jgi:signal transduction histidine kinase